jgi:hypothetical protein
MILKSDTSVVDQTTLWDTVLSASTNDASITNGTSTTTESIITKALNFSSTISTEYSYVKWNLGHFDETEADAKSDFDKMLAAGLTDDMITPINRYMNFDKIDDTVTPQNFQLDSGYKLWISDGDVVVGDVDVSKVDDPAKSDYYLSSSTDTSSTVIKGVIIAKGDVSFNSKVTRFEGLIIAGGKIYVSGNLKTIVSSSEICRSIIKECLKLSSDSTIAKKREYVRSLFKQYDTSGNKCPNCGEKLEEDEDGTLVCPHNTKTCSVCAVEPCGFNMSSDALLVDVANIDYPDVCSIDNWTKTVE